MKTNTPEQAPHDSILMAPGSPENSRSDERKWWKEAVVYQIYPRSFKDSDGDGIGDLPGIIEKLDYVKSLGVDVIWLSPIFASPNDDNGYDISDYYSIMHEFGTMDDFDRLLAGIHERGLRLILDLVANHTSDEHPWFQAARTSRTDPHYTWYNWWPAEKGEPPYRESFFDETAWEYNAPTDSYYLHYFSKKQPDLNWSNPDVRQAIYQIMRFWFEKGIDGFRMDAIPFIGKDTSYPVIDRTKYPYLFDKLVEHNILAEYLSEMNREVLKDFDVLTVGEGSSLRCTDVSKFVEPGQNQLQMMYHFGPSEVRNFTCADGPDTGIDYSLIAFKQMFDEWDKGVKTGWPTVYLGNHDQPRMVSRFGDDSPQYREISAKMLTTFLMTLRGTVYWYAGDELGMSNARFDRIEDYNDIETVNAYKKLKKEKGDVEAFLAARSETSRDNARTPFQWDSSDHAGFTTGKPWLRITGNYSAVNVETEEQNPNSVLNYFRRMRQLRRETDTLNYGDFELINPTDPQVFAYLRNHRGESAVVLLNFSPYTVVFDTGMGFYGSRLLISNYPEENCPVLGTKMSLRPYEALVYGV